MWLSRNASPCPSQEAKFATCIGNAAGTKANVASSAQVPTADFGKTRQSGFVSVLFEMDFTENSKEKGLAT